MSSPRVLIYLLRRDLRLADNPIFNEVFKTFQQSQHPYTHLLPVYVFAAQQIEVSGFLAADSERSPFPEARSNAAGFWRCGPHRARFLAESVWDLKKSLGSIGSGLDVRAGMAGQVIQELLSAFNRENTEVAGVWMTDEEGVEEKREERDVKKVAESAGAQFRLFTDEKYYIDDRDIPFRNPKDLPDIFTTYRKQVEPLRDAPRRTLPAPSKLPPLPSIPPQSGPFNVPNSLEEAIAKLHKPLDPELGLAHPPVMPTKATSAHPFHGGESTGHDRIKHLIVSGTMSTYKDTRNGMLGLDFSTKLSAWLALGCVTARQVHEYLLAFEDGKTDLGKGVQGYGKGENKGTAAVRFELLWRDYFRLTTRKFGPRLFRVEGFKNDTSSSWKYPQKDKETQHKVTRFLEGTTGTGFIDASMRELFLTGYTSNRLRQNVASYLAKHLGIDWRVGAEWYESLLVDYDLSSNWGNWQYTAGVGNDPREARVFNPVKQAHDYDPHGEYVKNWVEELRSLDDPQIIFQPWKLSDEKKKELGLAGNEWVEQPLKRIEFHVGR
ncbi:cryptochrome, partial [Lecanoromycetidae sp. Uapishka_2]